MSAVSPAQSQHHVDSDSSGVAQARSAYRQEVNSSACCASVDYNSLGNNLNCLYFGSGRGRASCKTKIITYFDRNSSVILAGCWW